MLKRKRIRNKGKAQLSRYFKEFKQGDKISIVRDLSYNFPIPGRFQGTTGTVLNKRGESYVIELKDMNKKKTVILQAVHLKKLKDMEIKGKKIVEREK